MSSNKPIPRHRDVRARHSVARAAAAVLSACLCTHALGQTATAGWNGAPPGGIWKAAVPPTQMKGEFDNFDPIGIAAGARIKADCSINWSEGLGSEGRAFPSRDIPTGPFVVINDQLNTNLPVADADG